jgi:acid stress-induced BolA-like protein IbaG/YrbA
MTLKKLIEEASKYRVIVTEGGGRHYEIELSLPDGLQFSPEQHILVNSEWDGESDAKVRDAAYDDLMNHKDLIQTCPCDCPCKETE